MRTPSSDRDAAITSWPPTRSYCGQSTGADAQGGAASGLPAIHPAAASPSGRSSIRRSQLRACRALRHRVFDGKWTSYIFQRERSTSLVVATLTFWIIEGGGDSLLAPPRAEVSQEAAQDFPQSCSICGASSTRSTPLTF